MDEISEQEIKDFKEQLRLLNRRSSSSILKYVSQIITVVVLTAGIIGSWYTTKAAVAQNSLEIEKQEKVIEKHQNEIEEIKIRSVVSAEDIKHIKEKVDDISFKMDRFLEGH